MKPQHQDEVAEWLRRWTANPMGSARVGSNTILVVLLRPPPCYKLILEYLKVKNYKNPKRPAFTN